ncbi:hypothetical protein VitviT2T_004084 [Vitis vinifera]|uniref:Uncharacterized protein n=1 Tax=Vitis vinifera TaxID=29760 RepID=A0ABY9BNZ9_VITVI|nr:hypothetical protein VitviT2T_004084 [Vitis vinifera]
MAKQVEAQLHEESKLWRFIALCQANQVCKEENQRRNLATSNFSRLCEIKRSFNSCKTESRNELKKFCTLCEISHTMRNQDSTMKEFRTLCETLHGMRNLLV